MAAVWEQRFARSVRAILGLRESSALEALPDLMPVLSVLDPANAELLWWRNEHIASGIAVAAPVAAQYPICALKNASATRSAIIVVVDQIIVTNENAAAALCVTELKQTALPASTGQMDYTDSRNTAAISQVEQGSGNNAALQVSASSQFMVPAGQSLVLPVRVVLGPGWAYRQEFTTVNTFLRVAYRWSERLVGAGSVEGL